MGRFVIAVYRPKSGQGAALERLLEQHTRVLRAQGLVTDRPAYLMRSVDGAFVEVFEWASAQAIEQAHSNSAVQGLWEAFERVCDYQPLGSLQESQQPFAEFEAVASR